MGSDLINGEVPSQWEFTTLGEVCRRGGGSIQTGPFGSQLHASDYVPAGVPSIMPTNIGDNRIVEDGIVRISEEDAKRLFQHRVKPGDIIYSRRGDVEKRALIRERESGWLCGTGCLKVRLGDGVVDPKYASFFLGHPSIREWVVRHAIGATMPNLNTSIMGQVPFLLPPLPEQRAIAHILGTLDDKIELNRRTSETLESMARALFKSWFVDFDPVRAKAEGRWKRGQSLPGLPAHLFDLFPSGFVDSELGEIPEGWNARTLSSVLLEVNERVCGESSIPEYSSTNDGLALRSERFKKQLSKTNENNKVVRRGCLVFGLSRRVLNFGLMRDVIGCVSPVYRVFSVDSSCIEPELLEQTMREKHDYYYNAVSASSREGQSISIDGLGRLFFIQQNKRIQDVFLNLVSIYNSRRKHINNQSLTLAALRDSLLPKLISGELRVQDAELFLEHS